MKIILTLLLIGLITPSFLSQISHGGEPYLWGNKKFKPLSTNKLATFDIHSLINEDKINEKDKSNPYRFAKAINTNFNLTNSGEWTNVPGGKLWRIQIESTGAQSLGITFSKYKLIEGAKLFIYNASKTYFIGSFTNKNNKISEDLGSTPIPGQKVIVELFEPINATQQSQLTIGTVAHDYKGFFNNVLKDFGDSGPCNINSACSLGDNWRDQIKSVALITLNNGTRVCTGALMNNTQNNGTPYFLTANHCLGAGTTTWMFIFGYESSNCNPNTDGSVTNSISGSTIRASNAGSDFALLELSSTPPLSYNVYYNGWDKSGNQASETVGIHHPSGDVKKISIDNSAPTIANSGGTAVWNIADWDQGTTEGGSSGSPLFDQNKRVVGQLLGGQAACGNNLSDNYGRIDVSWNGTNSSTRLNDWLDPNGTGVNTIDGYDPVPKVNNDITLGTIQGIDNIVCGSSTSFSFDVFNSGINTVANFNYLIKVNNNIVINTNWNGTLASGNNTTISIPPINVTNGTNNVEIAISSPNGAIDPNQSGNIKTNTFTGFLVFSSIDINITLDSYGSETTWEMVNANNINEVFYSGGPYTDNINGTQIKETVCLGNGCYRFIIRDAANDGICCQFGQGDYSIDYSFGTNIATSDGQFTSIQARNFCVNSASIEEQQSFNFKVFPNPASNFIKIESENKLSQIKVFNSLGKLVINKNFQSNINIEQLTNGIYFIELTSKDGLYASKKLFVIK